jgi:hypothetical protein
MNKIMAAAARSNDATAFAGIFETPGLATWPQKHIGVVHSSVMVTNALGFNEFGCKS